MTLACSQAGFRQLLADLSNGDYDKPWPKVRLYSYGTHSTTFYVLLTKRQVRHLRPMSDKKALQQRYCM